MLTIYQELHFRNVDTCCYYMIFRSFRNLMVPISITQSVCSQNEIENVSDDLIITEKMFKKPYIFIDRFLLGIFGYCDELFFF